MSDAEGGDPIIEIARRVVAEIGPRLDIEWGDFPGEPTEEVAFATVIGVLRRTAQRGLSLESLSREIVTELAMVIRPGWGDLSSRANQDLATAVVRQVLKDAAKHGLLS